MQLALMFVLNNGPGFFGSLFLWQLLQSFLSVSYAWCDDTPLTVNGSNKLLSGWTIFASASGFFSAA
jgi:hypothetical protein